MTPWKTAPLVAIDTETTGIDVETARVWELAAVYSGGRRDGLTTSVRINPTIPIPAEVVELCGLTAADLEEIAHAYTFAPPCHGVQIPDGAVVCSYNGIAYDWPVLRAEHRRVGITFDPEWPGPSIDVLVCFRHLAPYWSGRYKLAEVAERVCPDACGVAHRAAADCVMTLSILRAIQHDLPDDLDDLVALQAGWAVEQAADYATFGRWLCFDRSRDDNHRLRMRGGKKYRGMLLADVPAGYKAWVLAEGGKYGGPLTPATRVALGGGQGALGLEG